MQQIKQNIEQNYNTLLQADLIIESTKLKLSVAQLVDYLLEATKPFLKPLLTKSLTKLVEDLDNAYYNKAKPLADDGDYDYIRSVLNSLDPKAKAKVGAPVKITVWPKCKLDIPMGSLKKETRLEDLLFWANKYTQNNKICYSDKMDGSSVELTYKDGKFVRGVSRGSGEIGDDLTPNIAKMKFPKTISLKGDVKVRGEVVLHKSDWKRFFPEYKNPRNSAAGTMRRLDGERCEHLRIYAFWLLENGVQPSTKEFAFHALNQIGFHVPRFGTVSPGQFEEFLEERKQSREALDYEIDGIVFEENNTGFFEEQGEIDNRPRAARAFKFESLGGVTKLLGVIWQVGRQGVITPVGELEPVNVGGVTISRVMLNNIKYIRDLNLEIGCQVEIIRCNDVIPAIKRRV